MKNIVIDNQGVQFPQNKTKKTQLESQIAELQQQEKQITKQLKSWEAKAKKANNLANCLWTAEKFSKQFLNEALESEKKPRATW